MTSLTETLPTWSWDDLKEALLTFASTPEQMRTMTQMLETTRAIAPTMDPRELLTDLLVLIATAVPPCSQHGSCDCTKKGALMD